MNTQRYTVRKIYLMPLAKFGCVLGGLAMLLPGLLCALGSIQLVSALRRLLEGWQEAELDPLGMGMPVVFDFIRLLGLETVQAQLIGLDNQPFILALLIVLVSVIAGGLLTAVIILLVGWGYNALAALTGGIEVVLKDENLKTGPV